MAGLPIVRRHKARYHQDERRRGWFSVFSPEVVDVNVVRISRADTLVGLHRHKRQTDYWLVIQGSLLVGVAREEDFVNSWHDTLLLTEKDDDVLEIQPGIWHGYRTLEPNTILIYGITERYLGDHPDEERTNFTAKGIDWYPEVR
jgi:dTDP-4-dehydrorhamnose 3,5-epimerase-like enzyme